MFIFVSLVILGSCVVCGLIYAATLFGPKKVSGACKHRNWIGIIDSDAKERYKQAFQRFDTFQSPVNYPAQNRVCDTCGFVDDALDRITANKEEQNLLRRRAEENAVALYKAHRAGKTAIADGKLSIVEDKSGALSKLPDRANATGSNK